jgi:8-oxo-dGTP pyrophosphatase MutT (NUDIX family)
MTPVPATPACPPPTAPLRTGDLARALTASLAGRAHRDIAEGGRRAAVLMLLFDRADEAHLLLTKRSEHLPSHPGQISLPGGVREATDESLMHTALRETHEEVGIAPDLVHVLGRLDDVDTIATGFLIRPFVAVARGPLSPVPADDEVARVLEVPVAEILRVDAALPADAGLATMRYPLDGEDVWGATARILRTFSAVARCALAGAG